MHNLVPQFILEQLAQNNRQGSFTAVGLFVDVSGFTQLMETLMKQGQHGAEVMASVMLGIFDPLVEVVFAQGGFVGNFAGDAFTAYFPIDASHSEQQIANQGMTAVWQAQQHLTQNPLSNTPYGDFTMSAKFGLALGAVQWGILADAAQERAAFYFRGTAVDGCSLAEKQCEPGDVVLDAALAATLAEGVSLLPRNDFFVLNGRPQTLTPAQPIPNIQLDLPLLSRFFPQNLITQPLQGEFRQIVNVFISLPTVENEAEIAPFMETVFGLQAQFGSVTSRLDFGDKGCTLLLFWGAPIAHETDIERALSFVLALREQSDLPIRAGVTYRVAHAGFIGSPLHEEFTCYGSGVNLAARFMIKAPTGEIWLDTAVFNRANRQFNLQFVDNLPFKGFAAEQPVYRLVGEQGGLTAPIFSGEMLGREPELAQLHQFIQPLANGRFAGAMRVEGEAGIGKSRLLHAFFETLPESFGTYQIFLCQTDQILRQSLNPLRYWLNHYFNQSSQNSEAENKENFDQKIYELIALTESEKLVNELARTRSFLGALVDLYWPKSLYEQLEPQGRFENTLIGLTTLLRAESLLKPTLLTIEDVHWLDDDSRQFLQQLWLTITAVPDQHYPLAILSTSRPEQEQEETSSSFQWQRLPLGQLTQAELNQLAVSFLGGPISPSLQTLLRNRGEGNPFFTEQIVRYLQEQDLLEETEAGWAVTAVQDTVLPQDVHALLVARLDRLTAKVKNGVQHAAVLGREFEVRLLALMLQDGEELRHLRNSGAAPHSISSRGGERQIPLPSGEARRGETPANTKEPELNTILNEAEQATIWAAINELRYLFRHALVRDAAYKMQLRARRRTLHELAVIALETLYAQDLTPHYGELAYHAEQAQLTQKARDYLHKAGDVAREAYQNKEALDYYGRSLTLTTPTDHENRFQLHLAREGVYHLLGNRELQQSEINTMTTIAAALNDKQKQATVVLRQARLAEEMGDYPKEIAAAKQAVELAEQINEQELVALGHYNWGTAFYWQADYQTAAKHINEALENYRALSNRRGEGDALFHLSEIAIAQGDYQTGANYKTEVLGIVREQDNPAKEAVTLNSLGLLAGRQQEYGQARAYLEQALTLYQTVGNRRGESVAINNLGIIAHILGEYNQAHRYYQHSLMISREIGSRQEEAIILNNLGEVSAKQGNHLTAKTHYEQCLILEKRIGMRSFEAHTLRVYGETLLALASVAESKDKFTQAINLHKELKQEGMHLLPARLGLAQINQTLGNIQQAISELNAILEDLSSQTLDGLGDPLGFYWNCFILMQKLNDERAIDILTKAYHLLLDQAQKIEDPMSRRSFLENVPEHRLIVETASINS